MRKALFSITILLSTFTIVSAQKVKGSDTVLPLSQKLAELYMIKHPSAHLTITGGGSGVGISALMEETTDIAQTSRRIKFEEKLRLKNKGIEIKEIIIAYDALAVVIHPSNPINKLNREELEAIFRGKIKNWKEVGGPDLRIIPYARETSSGTYEFFKESVLKHKNYMNGIMSMPATGSIIQSIGQTKGAIGYVGLAYVNQEVKAIAVSYNKGETYTDPTMHAAEGELYPITRPLYFYYNIDNESICRPYIDYILSQEGQKTVREIGFVEIK